MTNNAMSRYARLTPGDILRTIRETRNIPIRVVSEASGVSGIAIQKIENNQSGGSIDTFIKLCEFYEIRIEDLVFWNTTEANNDVDKAKDILYKMLINAVSKRVEAKLIAQNKRSNQTDIEETLGCVDANNAEKVELP